MNGNMFDEDSILQSTVKDLNNNIETTKDLPHKNYHENGNGNLSDVSEDAARYNRANIEDTPVTKRMPFEDTENVKNIKDLKLTIPELEEELENMRKPTKFMDDGEPMREPNPGFQDLGNCKRFWKAQQLIGTRKISCALHCICSNPCLSL